MDQVDELALQSVYRRLNSLIGTEAMLKVWQEYRGTQINLSVHLYDREKTANQIIKNYNGQNERELAKNYGYSQRWVMQIINTGKQGNEG